MGRVRFVFLPLGLLALVAVGVHAAADVASGQLLWIADRVDAFFDALFSRWSVTAPLVDLVGLAQRTTFARCVALVWELCGDALLALPMLGYDERTAQQEWLLARQMVRRTARRPMPGRIARPIALASVSVAGACSVARLCGGSVRLALHAPTLGKLLAILTLAGVLFFLVPRALFRAVEYADARGQKLGLFTAAIVVPLAIAAVFAAPLGAFFR